jgi:Tfp pilus assembly protein PilX
MKARTLQRQRGMTLVISLVMLVILTLFVVSGIRIANINLRITGNYQWQKAMEALTDQAIEQVVTTSSSFDDSAVQAGTATDKVVCADGTVGASGVCTVTNSQVGTVQTPRCLSTKVATGYSKKIDALSPDDNDWLIKATATDSVSGAKVTIYRGVTVRQLANSCPA